LRVVCMYILHRQAQGVLIDVLEIRENIAFGDKLCQMA